MLKVIAVVFCCCLFSVSGDINEHKFPENFTLGVATSAYQIEGAWDEDGKGEHMWDWWTHTYPEKILNGSNGDVACDSYHKWQEDVELLKTLGVGHYRLSISWSRILPDGLANNLTINQEGVTYYRNLLQALVNANITPYVTLYHWDLPLPLHQLGGWQNSVIADHFAAYARVCFNLFGDLVKNWMTLNEPHIYCLNGYEQGVHAPGYQLYGHGVYKCAYTSMLAHAKAYHIYDDEFRQTQGGRISIVLATPYYVPASNSSEDIEAVQRQFDFVLGLYANPIYVGNWPEQVIEIVDYRSELEGFSSSRLPKFTDEEIDYINGTSDFFSLNSYATQKTAHANSFNESIDPNNVTYALDVGITNSFDSSWPSDVSLSNLVPGSFRKLLNYIHETYGQPEIVITENGWAQNSTTDSLEDQDRITYITQYLSDLLDAVYEDGVTVTGYTVWSFLDNLAWQNGYSQRTLGLVRVDFSSDNRTRTIKDSYGWYQGVIENGCLLSNATECVSS